MIAHTSVVVSDYARSKDFYQAVLAPLGYTLGMDVPDYRAAGFTESGKQDFWIGQGDVSSGTHVAFGAPSRESVHKFYLEGVRAGGKDNGAPGYRTQYAPGYYAAFLHDLDGNNIEAVFFDPNPEQ